MKVHGLEVKAIQILSLCALLAEWPSLTLSESLRTVTTNVSRMVSAHKPGAASTFCRSVLCTMGSHSPALELEIRPCGCERKIRHGIRQPGTFACSCVVIAHHVAFLAQPFPILGVARSLCLHCQNLV